MVWILHSYYCTAEQGKNMVETSIGQRLCRNVWVKHSHNLNVCLEEEKKYPECCTVLLSVNTRWIIINFHSTDSPNITNNTNNKYINTYINTICIQYFPCDSWGRVTSCPDLDKQKNLDGWNLIIIFYNTPCESWDRLGCWLRKCRDIMIRWLRC